MYESPLRRVWRAVYPALLLIGIYLLVYLCAILLYPIFFASKFPLVSDFMSACGDIVSVIALLCGAAAAFFIYRKESVPPSDKLFSNKLNIPAVVILGITGCLGIDILISIISELTGLSAAEGAGEALTSGQIIILALKAVVLAPIAEEITFRGLCFGRIMAMRSREREREKEFGPSFFLAAVVSSLLFGIYHLDVLQGIYAFFCGIIMCFVYHKFQNLWASGIFHAAANALMLILSATGALNGIPVWGFALIMAGCFAVSAVILIKMVKSN